MIDRRQFLQLIGATGAAFYLPRVASSTPVADPDEIGEFNTVTVTIEGLKRDTRWAIMDEHNNMLADGSVKDDDSKFDVLLPKEFEDRHVHIHAIELQSAMFLRSDFVAKDDSRLHLIQIEDRNYVA